MRHKDRVTMAKKSVRSGLKYRSEEEVIEQKARGGHIVDSLAKASFHAVKKKNKFPMTYIIDGREFTSINDAARTMNISTTQISRAVKSGQTYLNQIIKREVSFRYRKEKA